MFAVSLLILFTAASVHALSTSSFKTDLSSGFWLPPPDDFPRPGGGGLPKPFPFPFPGPVSKRDVISGTFPGSPIVISKKDVDKGSLYQPANGYRDPTVIGGGDGGSKSGSTFPTGPLVVSRRDDSDVEDVSVPALIVLITSTIDNVQKGISADDLTTAVEEVKNLADTLLANNGGQFDPQEVVDLILEVSAGIGDGSVDISVLFDDPLKFEGRTLAFALRLWIELASRLTQLDAEGNDLNTILTAISFTCDVIQNALDNTVHLMGDLLKGGNPDITKRQGPVNPSVSADFSKTFKFDSGSLTVTGTVGTKDFQSVDVGVKFSFKF